MTDDKLKKILILDDDADLRRLLLTHLGKMFPDVELEEYDPVSRGIPGQDFDWSGYDVLVLDYYLSIVGNTGLDLLQSNRKNPAFPAVIMLTGAGNEEIAVRALKAGVYDYLRKQNLSKNELKNSILNAFHKHQTEKQRLSELTRQGHAFNKAIFYQQLEYEKDDPEYRNRIFLLVELDDHTLIEEHAGIILRDNIVRHIAKRSYETIKQDWSSPVITRLGDHYIALLVETDSSRDKIEAIVSSLINHLGGHPYTFGNNEFPFTVSIGIVSLTGEGQSADKIIQQAKSSCKIAGNNRGNSFYIYSEDETGSEPLDTDTGTIQGTPPPQKKSVPLSPAEAKPKPVDKPAPATEKPVVTGVPDKAKTESAKDAPTQTKTASSSPTEAVTEPGMEAAENDLKQGFDDKRVIQVFQPVISLLNEEIDTDDEIHRVFLQHINKDGSITTGKEVRRQINSSEFRKFVDRWVLREIIGKLTNTEKNRYTFIVDISDASLADAGFFNWLRKLLTGVETSNPGKYLALEINVQDLARLEKQTNALITYLRKSHDFKFVLGGIKQAQDIIEYTAKLKFDFVHCGHKIINELSLAPAPAPENEERMQIDAIRQQGTRFIADDVVDASVLTEAISYGAEYAMGDFIGEATDQLDDVANIESLEIA